MSRWSIYDKNGNERRCSVTAYDGNGEAVKTDSLEYSGSWMGECFLSVSVKSPYPIDFQIGDYIEYRGERFVINYDPSVIKKARRGSYGEGFVYDNVKFNSYSNELTLISFHDRVLSDSGLHYTSLPDFSTFCKDVDDLVDRLQANTDKWCKDNGRDKSEYWMFYTLSNNTEGTDDNGQSQTTYDRTLQRAMDVLASCGLSDSSTEGKTFLNSVKSEWETRYGTGTGYKDSRDDERYDRSITVSSQTVWEGLSMVKTQFGLNFIIRGRNVYIGTAGVQANELLTYGKGNGLYEIDRTADTDQKVVTKLHAYGSNENMPTRYYSLLNKDAGCIATGVRSWDDSGVTYLEITTDMVFSDTYFRQLENTGLTVTDEGYKVSLKCSSVSVSGYMYANSSGYTVFVAASGLTASAGDIGTLKTETENAIKGDSTTAIVYITSGVRKEVLPDKYLYYTVSDMPDNLVVNSLMLPGFPNNALSDICRSSYDSTTDTTNYYITNPNTGVEVMFHSEEGNHVITFSSDKHDPYIVSPNASSLGIREGDISCTEENDDNGLEKVYPSIEEVTDKDAGTGNTGKRLDEVVSADTITDTGVFPVDKSETSIPGFKIYIPELGFDLKQAAEDAGGSDMQISMKNGFCGGRTFSVTQVSQQDDGTWQLTCKRSEDSSLDLWFPYSYAASVKSAGTDMTDAYQILSGDRYVLTGIYVNDTNYVWAAGVKLLRKAIHWLCKNDYTRYVYAPKIDEIYMARQAQEAKSEGKTSLHDSLKEGDVLYFSDSDLLIDGSVYIDKLSIKENGNNGIPTYDVTLRDEITVGTLQRIQNKVDSIANDIRSGSVNVALAGSSVEPLVKAYGKRYFLSKLTDDIASGLITFAKGLVSEAESTFKAAVSILSNLFIKGHADVEGELTVGAYKVNYEQGTQGFKVEATDSGVRLQTDYLDVTKKLTAREVTIQKVEHIGGKQISTAARMICSAVTTVPAGDSVVSGYKCSYSDAQTDVFLTEEPKDKASVTTAELSSAVELDTSHVYYDVSTGLYYTYNSETQKLTETSWTGDIEYRCFFEQEDSDGRKVCNLFKVEDLAYCQTFNIEKGTTQDFANSYYWRKVTAVGDNYIQLSDYKKDPVSEDIAYDSNGVMLDGKVYGSTAPQSGDEIVLLGNISDKGRQGAIIQASADTWSDGNVPYFSIYTGIKSFVLPKAKLHFSPGSSWITGTDITITATSGEVNLQEYVDSLSNGLTDVKKQVDESFLIYQSDDPYLQTDGTYVPPTLDSEPASEWTTDELKAQHVGDFYLSSDGFCWKFVNDNGVYEWTLVVDKYLTAYVREIGEKKRVFTSRPTETAVYDIGDLWVNVTASGTDGNGAKYDYDNDMLVCVQAKVSGNAFDFSHWQAASNTKTEIRSGLLTNDGMAALYSQYVKDGKIVSTATVTTAINNSESEVKISADKVQILSENFKVIDGSVYAHDLTLTGAFNNMRTEIKDGDLIECDGVHTNENTIDGTSFKCFDLLCTGSIISLQLKSVGYIALPSCYGSTDSDQRCIRTKTRFNGTVKEGETNVSPHSITIAEMRMLVGKKLYVYNDGTQSPTILVGRRVLSESDGVVVFDDSGSTGTAWVEEGISTGSYRIYECCLGCENLGTTDNSAYYECIYWKPIGNVGNPLTEFN